MFRVAWVWPGIFVLLACGCSEVPPLSHATNNLPFGPEISIHDVVVRVKCELADALDRKMQQPKFAWLQSWTVKADLTLQTNETGGLTPSVSYIDPLRNAYFLGGGPSSVSFPGGVPGNSVGATPQNFSLGLGATYSAQVFRTETVSFTLSLRELQAWREKGEGRFLPCLPVGRADLQGNLDIAPWIDAALGPVDAGDLRLGIHPSPGSGAKSTAPAGSGGRTEAAPPEDLQYYKDYAKNAASDALKAAQQANGYKRQAIIANYLDDTAKRRIADYAREASKAAILARRASDGLGAEGITSDEMIRLATNATENSEAATRYSSAAKLLVNPDPPIDAISHALNFVVTVGAGISPNWALLHWKGPANVGNLASFSGVRTHTLNIAMGSPSAVPSTDVARLLNNEAFRQAVQSPQ